MAEEGCVTCLLISDKYYRDDGALHMQTRQPHLLHPLHAQLSHTALSSDIVPVEFRNIPAGTTSGGLGSLKFGLPFSEAHANRFAWYCPSPWDRPDRRRKA